jgi:probable phosphoglycerate mutase
VKLVVHVDGGARGNPGPAAAAAVVSDADGTVLDEATLFIGEATNNVAEYRGLLAALAWAAERGERGLHVRSDSELLVRQMRGEYRVKNPGLRQLHQQARRLLERFERVTFEHVPRTRNRDADRLANAAMDAAGSSGVRTPDAGHRTSDDASRGSRQHALPFDEDLPDNAPHSKK